MKDTIKIIQQIQTYIDVGERRSSLSNSKLNSKTQSLQAHNTFHLGPSGTMIAAGEPIVNYKWTIWVWGKPLEVQDCRKCIDHFRGIYRIFPNLKKESWRLSTLNWLDLQTLGSQSIMLLKNHLDHCSNTISKPGWRYIENVQREGIDSP